jgi:DNA-binding transcriptional MocR family regulator
VSGRLKPLFSWRGAISDSDLPPTTRHVALALSLHMNERGGSAFPAVATLARETGLSESTVREHLHQLRDSGWLSAGERGRPGLYHGTPDHKGESHGGRHRTVFYSATIPPDFQGSEINPPAAGEFSSAEARETLQLTDGNPPAAGGDLYKNSPRGGRAARRRPDGRTTDRRAGKAQLHRSDATKRQG